VSQIGTVACVVLVVLAAAGGLIAGRVRRPAGGHGAQAHLRLLPLVGAGLALGAAAVLLDGDLAVLCSALSIAVLAVFAGVNRNVTGLAVVGVGLVLNLAAVVLNNGMPVRAKALVASHAVRAGHVDADEVASPRHLETDADGYAWLGAIVPVRPVHDVVSFGDLIVVVGLFDAARELGRRRSRLPEVDDGDELFPVPPEERPSGERPPEERTPGDQPGPAATTAAKDDHDWGAAPRPAPESGSQCSEKPFTSTADINEFWKDAALPPSPAHLAARHDR
jgi:hypothetical protein